MTTPTARERAVEVGRSRLGAHTSKHLGRNGKGGCYRCRVELAIEREILAAERAAAEAMRERCADYVLRAVFARDSLAMSLAIRALPLEGDDAE